MILKSLPIAKEFLTVFIPPKFTVEADGIDRKPELALLKANDDNSILCSTPLRAMPCKFLCAVFGCGSNEITLGTWATFAANKLYKNYVVSYERLVN